MVSLIRFVHRSRFSSVNVFASNCFSIKIQSRISIWLRVYLFDTNKFVQSDSKYLSCFLFISLYSEKFSNWLNESVMFMKHLTVIQLNWSNVRSPRVYMHVWITSKKIYRYRTRCVRRCITMIEKRYIWENKTNTHMHTTNANGRSRTLNIQSSIPLTLSSIQISQNKKDLWSIFIFFIHEFPSFTKELATTTCAVLFFVCFFSSFEMRTMDCIEIIIRNRADISVLSVFMFWNHLRVCLMRNRSL